MMDEYGDEFDQEPVATPDAPRKDAEDNKVIRDLREKADRAAAAERELAEIKRERAFDKAMRTLGIPSEQEEKFQRLASKMVEGEPDEAKLRDLATDYGFLTTETQARADAQAQAEVATAHVGGAPVLSTPDEYDRAIGTATSAAEVIELARKAGVPIKGHP